MRKWLVLLLLLLPSLLYAQSTTVTGTIADANGNPYANGTASAAISLNTGVAPPPGAVIATTPTPTNATGQFSLTLTIGQPYIFTICSAPTLFGLPTTNPTPRAICFSNSTPIAITPSIDVSTQLNALALLLGPQVGGVIKGALAARPACPGGVVAGQVYVATDQNPVQTAVCDPVNGWASVGGSATWATLTPGTNSNAGTFASTGNTWDFTGATHTRPIKVGLVSGIPGTCSVGEMYFATDATPGRNLYFCTAANVFTLQAFNSFSNSIDPLNFGVKANGQACFGANLIVTNATTGVTCYTSAITTNAAVVSNVATLTLSTALPSGWTSGNTIVVSGYTGGDTYLNGTFTITASTTGISNGAGTVSYALTHGNASSVAVASVQNQSIGPFVSGDTGKTIFATNGCCGLANNYLGVLILPQGTLTFVNSTQVTASIAATATSNGAAGGLMIWGSIDDAGHQLAENAWAASTFCPSVVIPMGLSLVQEPHYNNPPPNCIRASASQGVSMDLDAGVHGWNAGASVFVMVPNFDLAACKFPPPTGIGCFTSFLQADVHDIGVWGGGYGNTGNNAKAIFNPGLGSQFTNVLCSGFGGSDTSLVGIKTGVGFWGYFIVVDGCGSIGVSTNSINYFYFLFSGDTLKSNLLVPGGDMYDFGGTYGVSGGTQVVLVQGGTYHGIGSSIFSQSANNSTGLFIDSNSTAILSGGKWDTSACTTNCNGVFLNASTSTLHASQTTFKGKGAGGSVAGSSGTFTDNGGNMFSSTPTFTGTVFNSDSITGTLDVAGNHVLTSGWGTANVNTVTGATRDVIFTISITGGVPGASPVLTDTFASRFITAPGGGCTLTEIGGTFGVLTNPVPSSLTATGVVWTFSGTPISGQSYIFQRHCAN